MAESTIDKPDGNWLDTLYNDLAFSVEVEPNHVLRCENISGASTLLHSNKLQSLPPNAILWLEQFARDNGLTLRERLGNIRVTDELRKRRHNESQLALGVQLLAQQIAPAMELQLQLQAGTGQPQFRAATPRLGGIKLVQLARTVKENGQRIALEPNSFVNSDDKDADQSLSLYACVIQKNNQKKTFGYIESDTLRALVYPAANECLIELIVAGGFGSTAIAMLPFSRLHKERLSLTFFTHPEGYAYAGLVRTCYAVSLTGAAAVTSDFSELIEPAL